MSFPNPASVFLIEWPETWWLPAAVQLPLLHNTAWLGQNYSNGTALDM
jgi:hypothetical protein